MYWKRECGPHSYGQYVICPAFLILLLSPVWGWASVPEKWEMQTLVPGMRTNTGPPGKLTTDAESAITAETAFNHSWLGKGREEI